MATTYMTSTDPMAQGLDERYTGVNRNVVINVQDDSCQPQRKPEVILIDEDDSMCVNTYNREPDWSNLSRTNIVIDLDADIGGPNDMDSNSFEESSEDESFEGEEEEEEESNHSDSGMEIDEEDEETMNRRHEALEKNRASFRTSAIQYYKSFETLFAGQEDSGIYVNRFVQKFIDRDLSTLADVAKFFYKMCTSALVLENAKVLSVDDGACYSNNNKAGCPRGNPDFVDQDSIDTLHALLQNIFPPLLPSETEWYPQALYEDVSGKSLKSAVYDGLKAKFRETACGHFTVVEFIWLLNHFDNFVVKKSLKTGKSIDLIQLALDTQSTATSCNFTNIQPVTRRVLIAVLVDKTDFEAGEADMALLQGDISEEEQAQYDRLAATFPNLSVPTIKIDNESDEDTEM